MFNDEEEGLLRTFGIVNLYIMKQRNEFRFTVTRNYVETKKVKQKDLSV